jgi:ribonucleoside-diphosphate reductase alpha chain
MSISSLCNVTSSGIEPWVANAFTKKVNQGSFAVRNKYLANILELHRNEFDLTSEWVEQQWQSIKKANGSVQHLDWMTIWHKDVFKTAFEINQKWLIEFAGDRAPLIDQAQSLNLFIPGGSHVQFISDLHILAWKKKVKSLYYLRSTQPTRASTESTDRKIIEIPTTSMDDLTSDSCIGCG